MRADRQTDRHTVRNTPYSFRGEIINGLYSEERHQDVSTAGGTAAVVRLADWSLAMNIAAPCGNVSYVVELCAAHSPGGVTASSRTPPLIGVTCHRRRRFVHRVSCFAARCQLSLPPSNAAAGAAARPGM